ncbi:MAG: hypothetical protein IH628_10475, partial [Proteobacteria bacterium]|nr:hypothetical protein [Pseudomonadota bacterium]
MTIVGQAHDNLALQNPVTSATTGGFVMRFTCDGQNLRFSTYLSLSRGHPHCHSNTSRVIADSDSTFIVFRNVSPIRYSPLQPPLPTVYSGVPPVTRNSLLPFDTVWTSYLGRFSAHGSILYGSTFGHRWSPGESRIYLTDVERAVDGTVYILGMAKDPVFPFVKPDALYPPTDEYGSFVLRLNPHLDSVLTGTFFVPGEYTCFVTDFALDFDGTVLLTGMVGWGDLPVTPDAFQSSRMGDQLLKFERIDNFLARLSPNLTAVEYCSYLGGSRAETSMIDNQQEYDSVWNVYTLHNSAAGSFYLSPKIAPDGHGNIYMAGITRSPDFPLLNPIQASVLVDTNLGSAEATVYLTKFRRNGRPIFSTVHGGSSEHYLENLEILPCGRVLLSGLTSSEDFPLKNQARSRDVLVPGDGHIGNIFSMFIALFDSSGSNNRVS